MREDLACIRIYVNMCETRYVRDEEEEEEGEEEEEEREEEEEEGEGLFKARREEGLLKATQ